MPSIKLTSHALGFAALLSFAWHATVACAAPVPGIQTIVITGAPAPDFPGNLTIQRLRGLDVSPHGKVAFSADLDGPVVGGLWAGDVSHMTLVARTGQQAPSLEAGVLFKATDGFSEGSDGFPGPGSASVNDAGNVSFSASLTGQAMERHGVFVGGSDPLALVAASSQPAPGFPAGIEFESVSAFGRFNKSNQVIFSGTLRGPGVNSFNRSSYWLGGGGTPQLIVRRTDLMPNVTPPRQFGNIQEMTLSDQGAVLFHENKLGDDMLWQYRNGSLELFMKKNDLVPSMPSQARFEYFTVSTLNENDAVLSNAIIYGPGVTIDNNQILWLGGNGHAPRVVARAGSHVPGLSPQETLRWISYQYVNPSVINSHDDVTFIGLIAGPGLDSSNNVAIWLNRGSDVEMVVRNGDLATDVGPGLKFSQIDTPKINDRGQVLFSSISLFSEQTGIQLGGLWVRDVDGTLRKIIASGDQVDIDNGPGTDFRTVYDTDRGSAQITEDGAVAFGAVFTDGSYGYFVSRLVAVPEPSAAALAVMCFVALSQIGRRTTTQFHDK